MLPQGVPRGWSWQWPAPSQAPVCPHAELSFVQSESSFPFLTYAHVPSGWPVWALVQPWQVPLHAMAQQTPSAQTALAHWSEAVQAAPMAREPAHVPPIFVVSQNEPMAQFMSVAQAAHVAALQ